MHSLLIYFFIALGLSMDAFSLSLALGINKISLKKIIIISITVGIFHFIMPIIGAKLGSIFLNKLISHSNKIVAIILIVIAIQMYNSKNEVVKPYIDKFYQIIFLAFTVSIDSFSVGIGYGIGKIYLYKPSIIFALVSSIFTFSGLILGKKLYMKYNNKALYIGVTILIITAIKYIL